MQFFRNITILVLSFMLLIATACVPKPDSNDVMLGLAALLLIQNQASKNPTVAMTNNSGGPQSYFLYTNSSCSGTATYEFSNPVSNGSSTSAITISAGPYYISIFGVLCTSSAVSFENGRAYACTSTGSNVSCTSSIQ